MKAIQAFEHNVFDETINMVYYVLKWKICYLKILWSLTYDTNQLEEPLTPEDVLWKLINTTKHAPPSPSSVMLKLIPSVNEE